MLVIRGRLTPEVGAMFTKAIEAAMEALFQQARGEETPDAPEQAQWSDNPIEQRRADALELLAECALEAGLEPGTVGDRYQVVLHLQADSLERPGAARALDVSAETPNRSDVQVPDVAELDTGGYVSAETSRRIACEASRVVMSYDATGTLLDVGRKTRVIHRALHEGGFRVVLDADGSCRFYSSVGRPIPAAPPPPEVPVESAVELCRSNRRQGLDIDRMSGLPGWYGESLDLNRALEALRHDLDGCN